MKGKTVAVLVGGYIALSCASWIGSKIWLKKFLNGLEEPKEIKDISEEDEA